MKKLKHRPYECEVCKNGGEWNGAKLVLHVDHIDGNRLNNVETNLRYLCPNCHSQTPTYCGRNARKHPRFEELTSDEILEAAKGERTVNGVMRKLKLNTNNNDSRQKLKAILDENLCLIYQPSEEQCNKLKLLKASNIDFTKYGWAGEAAKILQMEPQGVTRWLEKNFPEFLVSCFRRKANKVKYTER